MEQNKARLIHPKIYVIDDKCANKCWRGYGPYTEPNMSFEERGRALFRVDIHE